MKLANKVAIVTGAGRGIGAAIAIAFAREGATLAICSRTPEEIGDVASKTRSNRPVVMYCVDVSDRHQVDEMVKDVARQFGRIDILVNNAGIYGPIGPFWRNDLEQWTKTTAINLFGTVYCAAAVSPYMIKQRKGKIINLAGGGEGPFPRFSAYSCSKSAIVRFTETLADELRQYNIDVNSIAPGPVNTRLLDQVFAAGEDAGGFLEKALRQKESGGVSAERAARLAVYLASESSDQLTGRLLSAVWDDWEKLDVARLRDTALYQTRRIDGNRFLEKA